MNNILTDFVFQGFCVSNKRVIMRLQCTIHMQRLKQYYCIYIIYTNQLNKLVHDLACESSRVLLDQLDSLDDSDSCAR